MFAYSAVVVVSALYPVNQDAATADPDTREFLNAVVQG
jgi:hypothetical protein